MANTIEAYMPDLDRIKEHLKNPEPMIVSKDEFEEVMAQPKKFGLYRGADMGDEEILRAMEIGWIKIWAPDGEFDLLNHIDSADVDFRLGQDFWHYTQNAIDHLTIGNHIEPIRDLELLVYTYKMPGQDYITYPGTITLAKTREHISLANTLHARFDGKSLAARLGLSNHQTAGHFHPGYSGAPMMEWSNGNQLFIHIKAHDKAGSMTFSMLGSPSTRPRNLKTNSESFAQNQEGPFGFWDPKWDQVRERAILQHSQRLLEADRERAEYGIYK